MKKLLLRYSDRALFPAQLTEGDPIGTCYVLSGGEEVCFRYLMTCRNINHEEDSILDNISRKIYNLSFDVVENAWHSRLCSATTWWHYVEMLPAERAGDLAGIDSKKESKRKKI